MNNEMNKIRIEHSLEVSLKWNCSSSDKEGFLYLVTFMLADGYVNDIRDIFFMDEKTKDGLEYQGVKKSTNFSSNTLTQTIKLNTKEVRNAIKDIYFLLVSFRNDNIADGKIVLRCDGKEMEHKYNVTNHQNLCIEFGHMKRCSDYWELELYAQGYKSIEIPYRQFAANNVKEQHKASDIFQPKGIEPISSESGDGGKIPIDEGANNPGTPTNGGNGSKKSHKKPLGLMPIRPQKAKDKDSSKPTNNKQDTDTTLPETEVMPAESINFVTPANGGSGSKKSPKKPLGVMPESKKAKDKVSLKSTSNSQDTEATLPETEVMPAKSATIGVKKKAKSSSKGTMPYKNKK